MSSNTKVAATPKFAKMGTFENIHKMFKCSKICGLVGQKCANLLKCANLGLLTELGFCQA